MTIYLSRASEKGKSFVPFSGSLIPHLNANWKLRKVQTEFAAYEPKLTTAEEHAAQFEAAGVPIKSLAEWVEFDRETHTVRLAHDPTTKFLETIVLQSRKEPSS